MRSSTFSSENMLNRSIKSEFIDVFALEPVIFHNHLEGRIPAGLMAGRAPEFAVEILLLLATLDKAFLNLTFGGCW